MQNKYRKNPRLRCSTARSPRDELRDFSCDGFADRVSLDFSKLIENEISPILISWVVQPRQEGTTIVFLRRKRLNRGREYASHYKFDLSTIVKQPLPVVVTQTAAVHEPRSNLIKPLDQLYEHVRIRCIGRFEECSSTTAYTARIVILLRHESRFKRCGVVQDSIYIVPFRVKLLCSAAQEEPSCCCEPIGTP